VQYFMVHEMTHIWQYENGFFSGNKKLMEGLACWAESKYAEELGEKQWVEYLRSNANPVYGDGFRFLASLEGKYGIRTIPSVALRMAKTLEEQHSSRG
jgi:hypothetical protein